jgi:hypothetical protein
MSMRSEAMVKRSMIGLVIRCLSPAPAAFFEMQALVRNALVCIATDPVDTPAC